MAGLPAILLTIACLLVAVTAMEPIARRLLLPETVLLALLGIAIGAGADALSGGTGPHVLGAAARVLTALPVSSETILTVFLPILVFAGALAIDVRRLAHDATAVLVMAVVAVAVSTAAIGGAVHAFSTLPFAACLLLGAIVATTDPSAVTTIFREIGAASRLTRLVEGEALLNDAAAISLFTVLLGALLEHHPIRPGYAALRFGVDFAGALVVGVAFGRLTLLLADLLGSTVAGEVSLTLALPFITYIVAEHGLGLSGVVAVAAAGLTMSAHGPSVMRPQTWRFLTDLWEQLAFWAGSLVFVLASMLVPRLVAGLTWHDLGLIAVTVAAALAARAAVLFGLLPALEWTRLSRPVPLAFKATIAWGGLRGAITLALALAVTENDAVPLPVAHTVGAVATGFVLWTLLVNGTTLRRLVVLFRLDRLSGRDEALRQQVLLIALGEVRDRADRNARELGFSSGVVDHVLGVLDDRIATGTEAQPFEQAIGDRDRVALALITVASRERTMLLEGFRFRGVSRAVTRRLLRTADAMVDGARVDGRTGYLRAVRRRLRPGVAFRLAQALHRATRFEAPLMRQMTIRYELLLVSNLVALRLDRFMRDRIGPVLGARVAEIVSEVLERRRRLLGTALDALRLHYPGYAEALETRVLQLTASHFESRQYDELLAESLIGDELHRELLRGVERRRRRLDRRLRFNLQAGVDRRVATFGLFAGLPDAIRHDLAMTLTLRFAVPGERLLRRGQRPRSVLLVSSGALEMRVGDRDLSFGEGDAIGAVEALAGTRMPASVRCTTYSHLLEVGARQFRRLVEDNPAIRRNLEGVLARIGPPDAGDGVDASSQVITASPPPLLAAPAGRPGE